MPNLMFTCPDCGADVDSRVEVDDLTLTRVAGKTIAVSCPRCQRQSQFTVRQGRAGDGSGQPPKT